MEQETKIILETQRLILREFCQSDFSHLAELLKDREVMYAYEHDFTDEEVQDWLDRQRTRYAKYQFGLWAVLLKETDVMIGQAGLTYQPCEGEAVLEVGYLLKRRFWHQGYAREAAAGCMRYAFETLGANKVYAVIKSDNLSSVRVAMAVGMTKEKTFTARYFSGDRTHDLYARRKE